MNLTWVTHRPRKPKVLNARLVGRQFAKDAQLAFATDRQSWFVLSLKQEMDDLLSAPQPADSASAPRLMRLEAVLINMQSRNS